MAIHITGSDFISRSSNVVQGSSNYTCIFWYNFASVPGGTDYLSPFVTKKTDYSQFAAIFSLGDGTANHEVQVTGGNTSAQLLAVNTWYPVGYVRNGTTQSFYLGSGVVGSVVENLSTNVFNDVTMGFDGFSVTDIQLTNFREWNIALSSAQILAEINSPNSVVHTANLVTFTPLVSNLLDVSGNGNNWTATGSPTFVNDTFQLGDILVGPDKLGGGLITAGRFISPSGTPGNSFIGIGSELGIMQSDGSFCLKQKLVDSGDTGALYLYDTNFNLVAISQVFSPTIPNIAAVASDFNNTYYVSNFQTKHVGTCNAAGVIGGTFYDLSGATGGSLLCIAPHTDNSVLYYGKTNGTGLPLPVQRWDLVNNLKLPDLVADIETGLLAPGGGQFGLQMLVIPTLNDLLVILEDHITNNKWIRRYATVTDIGRGVTEGQLLNTYPLGLVGGAPTNLSLDLGSPSKGFWARTFDDDGSDDHSRFRLFDLDTGTVITDFTVTNEIGGGNVPDTCPFFAWTNNWNNWAPTLTGTIVVGKASNPLATGVNFVVTGPGGDFTIQTDTSPGQVISVLPGTYSVVEHASAGYLASYFVSNDPVNNDNLNIVVGDGDLVDVVILNSLSTLYGGLYKLVPGKTHDTLLNQDRSTIDIMINWFWKLFIARDK